MYGSIEMLYTGKACLSLLLFASEPCRYVYVYGHMYIYRFIYTHTCRCVMYAYVCTYVDYHIYVYFHMCVCVKTIYSGEACLSLQDNICTYVYKYTDIFKGLICTQYVYICI